MGIRDITKSGTFVVALFVLVAVLVPFVIEEIGDTTGLFDFPVTKRIKGLFKPSAAEGASKKMVKVDWARYRNDLEEFSRWAEGHRNVVISLPKAPVEVIKVKEEEVKPERRMWCLPVVSCTGADPVGGRKGYVFVSGFDKPLEEGSMIAPSEELCGYEIVFIGERSVWLRVVSDPEGDERMGIVKFPEFERIEGASLVKDRRRYVARDAFSLASGGWLMIDSFMPPDGAVFKILDENRRVVTTILCIVIGEKGGR